MNSSQTKHGDYTRHPTNRQPQSSDTSSQDPSPSILKIPRIRLKSNKSDKKQSPTSPPADNVPGRNNKFSYIENSHLVNPVMIQQQQQKMSKRREQEFGGGGSRVGEVSQEYGDVEVDKEGTPIKPKKLPNPIKESVAMQSIHRELLLNQKIGRSVLTHKTELQKALEKLATKNADSDNDPTTPSSSAPHPPPMMPLPNDKKRNSSSVTSNNNKNEFQRILDARAKQIEEQKCFVDGITKAPVINESEFEKMHKRINKAGGGGVMQK